MGEEPEIEPKTILRRTRVEVMPYLRELARRSRAVYPRLEIAKRWIEYYEGLSKVRPLTKAERRKLEEHRKTKRLLESRLEVLRVAGKYARTKLPTDLIALRQAQSKYYEAKAEFVPEEKKVEFVEKMVPPRDLYEEFAEVMSDIEEKCKSYKAIKYRTTPEAMIMSPFEREEALKRIGKDLSEKYARAYELGQRGKSLSELIEHYKEMKRLGAVGY
ncbi:MAG: hypothetical protein NZ932_04065 [Candidatus Bathyarchaeota archaeon]|nr:hypothetical protein [Candidatus Bathyarchaeota archaeon]MDW8022355.1 hypothetical protein [Nitrososphaerota archaeon]